MKGWYDAFWCDQGVRGIEVGRRDKLFQSIRNNPKDVRFADALKAAELLGFSAKGGSGSHRSFARQGEPVQLNFQDTKTGKAKPYQVRQLIAMIDKYEGGENG